jgi:hypothetical protein
MMSMLGFEPQASAAAAAPSAVVDASSSSPPLLRGPRIIPPPDASAMTHDDAFLVRMRRDSLRSAVVHSSHPFAIDDLAQDFRHESIGPSSVPPRPIVAPAAVAGVKRKGEETLTMTHR